MRSQEFRDTEIGRIPREWEVVSPGDESIADLIMGQSPPSSTYNNKGIGLPFLQGNAEFGEMSPTPILSCSQPTKLSEKNDILLSVRAPVGDINITPYKLCIGRGLAAIRPKGNKLDYLFLFYYLKFGSRIFESLSIGSTFKAIRKEEVEKFKFPLPPLPEQQKIAEILSTVDQGIEKVDEAIKNTERLKKGLMQELLTKGIGHKEFKETEIGRIPKTWEIIKLNKLIEIKSGLYFEFSEFSQKGIKCLKIDNVGFGKIVWDSSTYLPENYLNKYSDFALKEGDIVIALNRPIIDRKLKIGILGKKDIPSILYQRVGKFFFKADDVNRNYIFHLFSGQDFKKLLSKSLVGTDQPYIRTPILLKLKFPFPPLPEQQKIAGILSTVDKRLELLRQRKEKIERIKKGLMNDLLTGKKRVLLEA